MKVHCDYCGKLSLPKSRAYYRCGKSCAANCYGCRITREVGERDGVCTESKHAVVVRDPGRTVPHPIVAWHVDVERPYRTLSKAYYVIAKGIILDKYPRWLTSSDVDDKFSYGEAVGWSRELVARRLARALPLLMDTVWTVDPAWDERKWKRLVFRLARHLRFVDKRRGIAAELDGMTPEQRHAEFEHAERQANFWMERAAKIRGTS